MFIKSEVVGDGLLHFLFLWHFIIFFFTLDLSLLNVNKRMNQTFEILLKVIYFNKF